MKPGLKIAIGALLAAALAPMPCLAQDGDNSTLSYPASYFATQNPVSAYDMVLRLPGFAFDDGAQVRGFAGAAGNVLVDGQRPTSKTDDLVGLLTRVPAAQVERIDVIRGGAPGIDMQGKTVMANVILKKAGGFTGAVKVTGDWTQSGQSAPETELTGVWRNGATVFEAGMLSITLPGSLLGRSGFGPRTILSPDGDVLSRSYMQNGDSQVQNRATAAYQTSLAGGVFRVNVMVQDVLLQYDAHDNFAPSFIGPDLAFNGLEAERDAGDTTDAELGLHYTRDLAPGLSLELIGLQHLSGVHSASDFAAPGDLEQFRLEDHGGESIARAIVHDTQSSTLTFDAGGELAFNWVDTRTRFQDNGQAVFVPAADVVVQEARGEAFATATWRPDPRLRVEAGMRVEASAISSSGDVTLSNRFVYPKPRLAVTWSPDAEDQVRFRIEREVGQLDFGDFAGSATLNGSGVTAGNPNLTPQQDWAFEAAYERRFWDKGVIAVTARRLMLSDVIDRVPVGAFDAPGNIGKGHEDDVLLSFTLPLDRLFIPHGELRGVGTWRMSSVTDPTTGALRPISGQHESDNELHFTQDIPKWSLTWGLDSYLPWKERIYRFDEVDAMHNHAWNQIFAEYKPRRDLSLRVEMDNLSRKPFLYTRTVYAATRAGGVAPAYLDEQTHHFGSEFLFRVVKSFGG